jgi:hypothetical protein
MKINNLREIKPSKYNSIKKLSQSYRKTLYIIEKPENKKIFSPLYFFEKINKNISKKESFYQYLFIQQIFVENATNYEINDPAFFTDNEEINSLTAKTVEKPNSTSKVLLNSFLTLTQNTIPYQNKKMSILLENLTLIPTASSKVNDTNLLRKENYLKKNKTPKFFLQDKIFITYKKSFLCYWLLPFLGLIGGAHSTFFQMNKVDISLVNKVDSPKTLQIISNSKLSNENKNISKSLDLCMQKKEYSLFLPVSPLLKKNNFFAKQAANDKQSVLVTILNLYKIHLSTFSPVLNQRGILKNIEKDLDKINKRLKIESVEGINNSSSDISITVKSEMENVTFRHNRTTLNELKSINDFSLAVLNRNIKARSNFKWYWFDLELNKNTTNKLDSFFPARLGLFNLNFIWRSQVLGQRSSALKKKSFNDISMVEINQNFSNKNKVYSKGTKLQELSNNNLTRFYLGTKHNEGKSIVSKNLRTFSNKLHTDVEQNNYLIGVVKKIQAIPSSSMVQKHKNSYNPYKSIKKATFLIENLKPNFEIKNDKTFSNSNVTSILYSYLKNESKNNLNNILAHGTKQLDLKKLIQKVLRSYSFDAVIKYSKEIGDPSKNLIPSSYTKKENIFIYGGTALAKELPWPSPQKKGDIINLNPNPNFAFNQDISDVIETSYDSKAILKRDVSDILYHCILEGLKNSLDLIIDSKVNKMYPQQVLNNDRLDVKNGLFPVITDTQKQTENNFYLEQHSEKNEYLAYPNKKIFNLFYTKKSKQDNNYLSGHNLDTVLKNKKELKTKSLFLISNYNELFATKFKPQTDISKFTAFYGSAKYAESFNTYLGINGEIKGGNLSTFGAALWQSQFFGRGSSLSKAVPPLIKKNKYLISGLVQGSSDINKNNLSPEILDVRKSTNKVISNNVSNNNIKSVDLSSFESKLHSFYNKTDSLPLKSVKSNEFRQISVKTNIYSKNTKFNELRVLAPGTVLQQHENKNDSFLFLSDYIKLLTNNIKSNLSPYKLRLNYFSQISLFTGDKKVSMLDSKLNFKEYKKTYANQASKAGWTFEKQFLSYLSLSKAKTTTSGDKAVATKWNIPTKQKLKSMGNILESEGVGEFNSPGDYLTATKKFEHTKNSLLVFPKSLGSNNNWFKKIYFKSKVKLIKLQPRYVISNSYRYSHNLNVNQNDRHLLSIMKHNPLNKNKSPLMLLKNRLFINKEIGEYGNAGQTNKEDCVLGQGSSAIKTRIRKKHQLKIKRRLKKMKKETRRRKKRKIFYPRPNWIIYSMYKKFFESRYLSSSYKNNFVILNSELPWSGAVLPGQHLPCSRNDNVTPLKSNIKTQFDIPKNLISPENFLTKAASFTNNGRFLLLNKNSNYLRSNRKISSLYYNPSEVEQNLKIGYTRAMSKNTKDFYQISRTVIGDLKRVLMKSNWLRSYLNPYLEKVKNIYKEMQNSSKKERIYKNLQSFILSIYGSNSHGSQYFILTREANYTPSNLSFFGKTALAKEQGDCLTEAKAVATPIYLNIKNSRYEIQNYLSSQHEYPFNSFAYAKESKFISKRQNTINLLEYNRIIYQRIQRIIFNIRDNLTLNGQIKNRSKKLGKNIRTFIKREYTKRDINGINTNQNATFWSKIIKSNILKFGRSFIFNGYEELSPYNNAAQRLSRNNFYWALNKSATFTNTTFDTSSVKKLWETYKIREVSKSNKTKKIIFNLIMKYNSVTKETNSLDGYNHLFLAKPSNANNINIISINKLREYSAVLHSKINTRPNFSSLSLLRATDKDKKVLRDPNVNAISQVTNIDKGIAEESLKPSFTFPLKTYTFKTEQKLINLEKKLKSLGLYSKKSQHSYKNAYFRFLKQQLLKETNLYTPYSKKNKYFCGENALAKNKGDAPQDVFLNIKQNSLNTMSGKNKNTFSNIDFYGSKSGLTGAHSYQKENMAKTAKMSNNNYYWWSFFKIDNAYYPFIFGASPLSSSPGDCLTKAVSTLSSGAAFLFHFCTLISFISLGGVRTLIKFYYILISKITKILSKVHKMRFLPKSYLSGKKGQSINVEIVNIAAAYAKQVKQNKSFILNSKKNMHLKLNKLSLKEFKYSFFKYLTTQSRKTSLIPFFKTLPYKTVAPFSKEKINSLAESNSQTKTPPVIMSDFENIWPPTLFVGNARFLFATAGDCITDTLAANINKKLVYTKITNANIINSTQQNFIYLWLRQGTAMAKELPWPRTLKQFSYFRKIKKNNKFLMANILNSFLPNQIISQNSNLNRNLVTPAEAFLTETRKPIESFIKAKVILNNLKPIVLAYAESFNYFKNISIAQRESPQEKNYLNKNKIKVLYYSFLKLSSYGKFTYKVSFYTYLLLLKSLDIFATPASFIYKFFEKPGEYVVENLAYSFLVEWSADLISTIPDTVDTTQALYFAKINRNISPLIFMNMGLDVIYPSLTSIKTPLGFLDKSFGYVYQIFLLGFTNSILKRFFNSSFLVFIQQLCEPDLDYINRQKKGIIFWDIWGEYLKTVAEENSINIYELTTDKEEQIRLLSKYEETILQARPRLKNRSSNSSDGGVPFEILEIQNYFDSKHSLYSLIPKKVDATALASVRQSAAVRQSNQSPENGGKFSTNLAALTVMSTSLLKEHFLKKGKAIKDRIIIGNSKPFFIYGQGVSAKAVSWPSTLKHFMNNYMHNKNYNYSAWSVSQFLSYQGKDTDLFIDLHPPKTFASSAASLKYSFSVQQPIGSIVCQIFSGIFYKQISKNILVIGSSGLEKSLLIQAIAGETELKIITDNAHRYAMVYRGVAVGIKLLRDVFEALSVHTPCIFLMEDIHAIGERRPFLIDESSPNATESTYNKNQSMQGLFLKEKSSASRESETKNNKHLLSHYKKPYKEPRGLATNHFSFTFLFGDMFAKIRKSEIRQSGSALSIQVIKKENESKYKNLAQSENNNSTFKNQLTSNNQSIYSSSLLIKSSNDDLLSPPASSPFSVLILKEATKLKHKKVVKEMPWFGLPGEQYSLVSKYNYSIRVKVALLADLVLSNLSVKLDMITDLLVIIDSVKGNRGFVVFATTHVPYILDPALRRPGRFDETISLPLIPALYSRWANYRYNVSYLTTSLFKKYTIPLNNIFNKGTTLNLTKFNLISSDQQQSGSQQTIDELINYIYIKTSTLNQRNMVQSKSNKLYFKHLFFTRAWARQFLGGNALAINKKGIKARELLNDNCLFLKPNSQKGSMLTKNKNKGYAHAKPLYFSVTNSSYLQNNLSVNTTSKYTLSLNNFKKNNLPFFGANALAKKQGSDSASVRNSPTNNVANGSQKEKSKKSSKLTNKQILKLKSKNYSYACKSLISLMLYTYKNNKSIHEDLPLNFNGDYDPKNINQSFGDCLPDVKKSPTSLKWPSMFQNSNAALEDYSIYLSLFSYPFMLKLILMSLIGGKLGENFFEKQGAAPSDHKQIHILQELKIQKSFININNQFLFNFDKTWKYASALLFSYMQKRQCSALNKNLAFCSTKLLSFNNKYSLMEAPSPPISNILLPAKRYENYKRTFNNQYGTLTSQHNFNSSISEKIQLHQQQRMLKRLYKYPIKEFFRSHILKVNPADQDWDGGYNFSNFNNSHLVLGPLEKTRLASLNKVSSINCCYKNIIYNRHRTYLTNQWWNGQQGEHNAETTFLSDIDWRYTFVQSIGDIQVDFPDSEQFYNPRNRRWILTSGDWNYWFNIQTELKDIYSHYMYECFSKVYKYLDQNREIIDFYADILHQTPLVSDLKERDLLNLYKRFFNNI